MRRQGSTRKATTEKGVYEIVSETKTTKSARQKIIPDACFYIAFKLDGKLTWEKIGWLSEGFSVKVAADIRAERMRTMRHGDELPQQKKRALTFEALSEKYLKWSAENKSREGIDDKSRYENHLKDRFDDKHLDEISLSDLEQMKSEMMKSGMSPKTILHCFGLIRAMYNWAADRDLYGGQNPIPKKRPGDKKGLLPTIQNARDRFLSVAEVETLLTELKRDHRFKNERRELKDPQLHDMALLSLHTGMRAGEIFNLTWGDVDFKNGLLTLRDTKNGETRYAPVTSSISTMLKSRLPENMNPGSCVFVDTGGGKIKEISNRFQRIIDNLGLNDNISDPRQRLVFHSLRHTFASMLAIQGTPLYTIAKLMGHKSIAMSERYSHLSPDHKKDAINGLEAALNGKF